MRWKSKFLLPALALLLSICVSFYLYLCFSLGRPITVSEFLRFSSTISWNALFHFNESGGTRSLHLAKEVLSNPVVNSSIDISGRGYSFPLPKYSVRQENQSYLTFATSEELQDYFNRELPAAGWRHVDQVGAGHFFECDGARMAITQHFYLGTGIIELNVLVTAQ
jgi:hypothetical protein